MLMVWLRRVLVSGLAGLLLLALLTGAYVASFNRTLGNSDTVETSLRKSNAYDQIASYAITRATQSTSTPTGSVSLNDPQVKALAKEVFSKQLVQQNAETFINSNYRWLNGETQTPAFTIDVSAARQNFAAQVNKTVFDYLTKLPACTQAQLSQILSSAVDPLTIACRPTAVVPKAEADRVAAQILSSDFLSQPVVTADTLKINGQPSQDEPYYVRFSKAPQAYQAMQKLPVILIAVALLASAGIVLISSSRRKGVRRVGLTFMFAGLLLVATKFASDTLFTKFQAKIFANPASTNTDVQKPLIDATHQLEKQIVATDLYIGIAFIIIGIILAIAYYRTRPRDKRSKDVIENQPATPEATPQTPSSQARQPVPTPVAPITKPAGIRLAQPAAGPSMDIARPKKQKGMPPSTPVNAARPAPTNTAPAEPVLDKKQQPRPRSRLIQ